MLLAGSDLLEGLHTVVLDEVHFLQDPYRGGVWEEVLVLSPARGPLRLPLGHRRQRAGAGGLAAFGARRHGRDRRAPAPHRPAPPLRRAPARGRGDAPARPCSTRRSPAARGSASTRRCAGPCRAARRTGTPRARARACPFRAPLRTELVDELDAAEHAAGHRLHLQPGRLRRRGAPGRPRRAPPDRAQERTAIRAGRRTHGSSRSATRTSASSATTSGSRASRRASPRTTPAWCRSSARRSRSASPPGCSRSSSPPRPCRSGINMPARSVVIERFTKFGGAGRATLTSGEYPQLTGRAGRRGLDEEGHAVVAWSTETTFAEVARSPRRRRRTCARRSGPPTTSRSTSSRASTATTASEVLHRSFAQWQARKPDLLTAPARPPASAVLEQLGYVDGWSLTPAGRARRASTTRPTSWSPRRSAATCSTGLEPSVLAGVLSCRGLRAAAGPPRARPPARASGSGKRRGPARRTAWARSATADLRRRSEALGALAERIRAIEEVHLVPAPASRRPGLATAVTSWARGASFATALGGGRPRRRRAGPWRLRPHHEVRGRPGPAGRPPAA